MAIGFRNQYPRDFVIWLLLFFLSDSFPFCHFYFFVVHSPKPQILTITWLTMSPCLDDLRQMNLLECRFSDGLNEEILPANQIPPARRMIRTRFARKVSVRLQDVSIGSLFRMTQVHSADFPISLCCFFPRPEPFRFRSWTCNLLQWMKLLLFGFSSHFIVDLVFLHIQFSVLFLFRTFFCHLQAFGGRAIAFICFPFWSKL